jgi:hypothetical protein
MKNLFIGVLLSTTLFIPLTSVEAASQPKAACGDASLVISNLPEDERKVAVRINDKANGWNLEKPFKGDFADKITPREGKYIFKAVDGHTYSWWVHVENADGTYGSAIGGDTYCGAAAPASLTASCKNNSIALSWKKAAAAERYAVRIDDTVNPWEVKSVLEGDKADNSVNGTKYTTAAQSGHGYNVWVHAVDKDGVFSAAKETFVSCKKNDTSQGMFSSIASFFSGLFK